ncbi:UDP-N-acetylmuramoyl-L-alanyl-D-glutamate--2,6-diaminopimelate ligase [Paenibacillus zeisoli]|uniref:UDP-N-acetylmuramoyl-L-alanyl-D-glutamate--2,6-diaminopimelate ligase n=1 Tax=Paenibacillus zeisoli TaxID=2496267 RepID=A0A3S1BX18_9BACL|nr:UDP-N-acetylmuramoyl-L-alanyl-D-glutamate--2,6-diaminopimelate ligase [Paenibacillus zeisoli]RUT36383.1 UDP-N-acetylmuramoyl-L-alanyl-D-glutamate--2,6-diaminopimelate ligase [Paenibacillus zeisoli]
MFLNQLAAYLATSSIHGDGEVAITGIQIDSRKVSSGDLFICLPGHTVDGHDFARQAAEKGAAALVVQRILDDVQLPQLKVKDCRLAMAVLGNAFYNEPSSRLRVIGVTGTNGKTTTTYLIEQILKDQGNIPGLIGTIQRRYAGQSYPMSGTTPESLDLQGYLNDMAEAECNYCVMEVSSHALEQGRVKGTQFRTAIFTNLTQDHLDYHKTMEEYRAAKGLFFSRLGNQYFEDPQERSYAVLNVDDEASAYYAAQTAVEVITYGVENEADVRASGISITSRGTSFHVDTFRGSTDINLRMVGKFNVYNALAAISAALLEDISLEQIKASLESLQGVEGRVEAVDEGQEFAVIVDYAHTPDGLENVLRTVKEFAEGRVICVFGCGGDRDKTKRPIMGQIAAKYSEYVFVTSDNPRTENPEAILSDIEEGLTAHGVTQDRYELVVDRKEAIEKAIEMASSKDVVLIAGKGHETYQLIGSQVLDFDDRIVAKEAIRGPRK